MTSSFVRHLEAHMMHSDFAPDCVKNKFARFVW